MLPQNRPTVKICGEKLALGEAGPYALGPVVRMRVYAFLPPAAALVLAGVAAGGCAKRCGNIKERITREKLEMLIQNEKETHRTEI